MRSTSPVLHAIGLNHEKKSSVHFLRQSAIRRFVIA
jgi:hypothetical protein